MTTDLSPAEFAVQLRRRAQTEGAQIAYETAVALCQDPKAPAQAKSAALNAILRMGGYFENPGDDGSEKQPHEMSAEEIDAEVLRLRRDLAGKPQGEVFD